MKVIKKEESIETLRGIAIILMVAGHVIGNTGERGLRVADDSVWRYIYHSFEYLRMPLFTAISGYVYALRPLKKEMVTKFIRGKARRILLPLLSVSTIQYIGNSIIPGVNNPQELDMIWRIYLFPWAQFWFLQALFLVFLVVTLLEYFNVLERLRIWTIVFIAALSLLTLVKYDYILTFFSAHRAVYLLPFFLLGIGIRRFTKQLTNKRLMFVILLLFVFGFTVQQLNWFNIVSISFGRISLVGVIVGVTGIWLLFYIRRPIKPLAWLGFFAYSIYLFHVFGTAGSRIIATKLGLAVDYQLFILGLIVGLGFPIIVEYILLGKKWLRRIFLGLR